ncbi:MAG: glucans biosynthesis glucosyltransferase MdoH [Devosia sp.]|jgi:membrane glycosyltransferase|uniref:glucans biosynthesis glucosyltransferase MdoH n=1 Tax=Devosia sp. TaxID=1871048 RepID=UPI0019E5AFF9|nr:glucans biosynthesis glucosyltransferase MdoH [Devosia sp.]MBF0678650.1 glucans biosynthesis glucosyltransferase MdoH [Devosia sp.]
MVRTILLRFFALFTAAGLSLAGAWLFLRFTGEGGLNWLDLLRCALVAISGFWLVWGGVPAVLGVFVPRPARPKQDGPLNSRTAILVPVYNEDPLATFARIAAMNRSLVQLGVAESFHFAVLSDTQDPKIAAEEVSEFQRLLVEPQSEGRIFYRRRDKNLGRKAGNIEDFVSRSGGAYDFALILDADSLMEGETIVAMARRLEADPELGLLQTVPTIINAQTLFGRSIQFAAAYLSRTYARGASLMQGREGPYWGHNAMVRMRAFAASCGLPELSGTPPFGGHILSHDYVEAALLSRAGWKVEVDPWLKGSYEEAPDNLIEYAKRDRRWCQGNLQHGRLLFAPGLKAWSRFTFIQGIMAYLASPLWLLLLVASIAGALLPNLPAMLPDFARSPIPVWVLGLAVASILIVPKLMILARGAIDGENRRFGGTLVALGSVMGEIFLSTLLAPTMLLMQSRSVAQVLLRLDGGWPATQRGQTLVPLGAALRASWWMVALAALALGATVIAAPGTALWLAPATVPALAAPLLIWATSMPRRKAGAKLFLTEMEASPSPVIREQRAIFAAWGGAHLPVDGRPAPVMVRSTDHVIA